MDQEQKYTKGSAENLVANLFHGSSVASPSFIKMSYVNALRDSEDNPNERPDTRRHSVHVKRINRSSGMQENTITPAAERRPNAKILDHKGQSQLPIKVISFFFHSVVTPRQQQRLSKHSDRDEASSLD